MSARSTRWLVTVLALAWTMACAGPAPESDHSMADREGHPPSSDAAHDDAAEEEGDVFQLTPEAESHAGIRTAPVEERVLEGFLETTGQVDFDHTRLAHVSPRIAGRVHRVNAALGQRVLAGQQLVEIDSIELGRTKATFLGAKAQEELARKSFERARGLLADRIVSEQEVLEAEAALREATARLRTTEETLHLFGLSEQQIDALGFDDRVTSIYPLRAPFSGTIVERHATLGELVTPERNLFTLADLGRVWIWIDVAQRDLGRVHLEDRVETRVDAFPDEVLTGVVSHLSATVDAETRTLRARIDVANPKGNLRPGMFVKVALVDPHSAEGDLATAASVVVPESALARHGDGFVVFVALGERRFEARTVRPGRRFGGVAEILSGLEHGETVVVEGTFVLKSVISEQSMGAGHAH